jgi:hypothetical protein
MRADEQELDMRQAVLFAQDRLAPVRSSAPIALACKNPVLGLCRYNVFSTGSSASARVGCIGTGCRRFERIHNGNGFIGVLPLCKPERDCRC